MCRKCMKQLFNNIVTTYDFGGRGWFPKSKCGGKCNLTNKQESRKAYGTAVGDIVIHLN